jgi:hypothetical protein
MNTRSLRIDGLGIALLAYCAASLTHFSHNAVFVEAYPNLPDSITPIRIWAVWLAEATIGLTGYVLFRKGMRRTGLALVALYAALAFDGLAHYTLAPMSAHTAAMNLTIWGEVIAGSILLVLAGVQLVRRLSTRSSPRPHPHAGPRR